MQGGGPSIAGKDALVTGAVRSMARGGATVRVLRVQQDGREITILDNTKMMWNNNLKGGGEG